MTWRQGFVERKTKETAIKLAVVLAEAGFLEGSSGIEFLDHMLELMTKHSGLQVQLEVSGDLGVDFHHTVEDIGLCLGKAFREALGDKKGITRYSSVALPMDETLVLCAVDLSGRPGFYALISFPTEKIGKFDSQLVKVFWQAFVQEAKITLHLQQLAGENSHHLAEAVFKGVGRALQEAIQQKGDSIPSSKGVL
ncbi:MAG TPA: imidazoleglycerol-phosphate dehydratase HisB [Clostridia bacterium]|jgi:imidazoleglycerol-phosphate dehydratase|nr:imidazoleglycerol-phosphate dehydratase HisB [Clostridia bacterium]HHY05513.1 imidazoleglycerol-phosphate dehydratase HisB [Clostridia bacterium]